MKHFFTLATLTLALTACVDTTGLSGDLTSGPHPQTSANAIVTVVEYADLQCPACRSAYTLLIEPLVAKYGTQIRYEFRHFPLSSIHRYAMDGAEAAECAADQGKFWEFIDLNYKNQEKLNTEGLDQWGIDLGLDTALYTRCRESHIKRPAILESYKEGTNNGVQGTPTFFVNGQLTPATIEALSAAIDKGLATAGMKL